MVNVETAIRGYHVYQTVWKPAIGEEFISLHEKENGHDPHAMGVYYEGKLVGHLPKEASKYCHYFTLHNGNIRGRVTGRRKSSPAGGMEIPCLLTFAGSERIVTKMKQLLQDLDSASVKVL